MFLVSLPNGLIFLKFHQLLKVMSHFSLLHIYTLIFLFTFPRISITLFSLLAKYVVNMSLKSLFVNHTVHCVDSNFYPEASLLDFPSFNFNPCCLLCCTTLILGFYSIPVITTVFRNLMFYSFMVRTLLLLEYML